MELEIFIYLFIGKINTDELTAVRRFNCVKVIYI